MSEVERAREKRKRIEELAATIRHATDLLREELKGAPPCNCGECVICDARGLAR